MYTMRHFICEHAELVLRGLRNKDKGWLMGVGAGWTFCSLPQTLVCAHHPQWQFLHLYPQPQHPLLCCGTPSSISTKESPPGYPRDREVPPLVPSGTAFSLPTSVLCKAASKCLGLLLTPPRTQSIITQDPVGSVSK